LVSVDGTDFRVYDRKPFWHGWYSHKFKAAAVRYEVAVSIIGGDIVWLNGTFHGGTWPDIKIFRCGLKDALEKGEKVEADRGYRGEGDHINLPDEFNASRKEKAKVRARHETANKRFKQWGCLNRTYRHHVSTHASVFRAVAVITQLAIENEEPLFGVEYNV
jgi:hypothetical protein